MEKDSAKKTTSAIEEKTEPVVTETDIKETETEAADTTTQSATTTWLIMAVIFVALLAVAIVLGLRAEQQFGGNLLQVLPKNVTSKLVSATPQPIPESASPQPTSEPEGVTYLITKRAKEIRDGLRYPNSTAVSNKGGLPESFDITVTSADSAQTIYDYYVAMAKLNDWEIEAVNHLTKQQTASIKIEQPDFSATITFDETDSDGENTKFQVVATYDNQGGDSTFNQPTTTEPPTPDEPPSDQDAGMPTYILPASDTKKVTKADLTDLSPWELKVARNEIYARHGREFVHQDLACYFADQIWYSVDPDFSTDSLSDLETANAVFILNYEKDIDSPLVNRDSGCERTEN